MIVQNRSHLSDEAQWRKTVSSPDWVNFATTQKLDGVRVLVVDDDGDARDLLRTILTQCKAEVKAAASVAEALEILKQFNPHVLLSDIEMPGEDGYALIEQVRRLEDSRGIQISAAALTAHAKAEDRLNTLAAGFDTHIAKPVEPTELVATIASLARRFKREQG
jgi:CheY-like chemotaxis protein